MKKHICLLAIIAAIFTVQFMQVVAQEAINLPDYIPEAPHHIVRPAERPDEPTPRDYEPILVDHLNRENGSYSYNVDYKFRKERYGKWINGHTVITMDIPNPRKSDIKAVLLQEHKNWYACKIRRITRK